MASTDTQLSLNPHHHVVKIEGAREGSESHGEDLIAQLKAIPSDVTALRIEEETPSNKEWAILGSHFTNIQSLELDSGYNEDLNDKELPLHWPLKRCKLLSACGEVTRTPHIRQGRVSHLILLLTSGIRFEGPTSSELSKAHSQAIARGEAKADYITVEEGTPEERQIQITWIPELAGKWMNNKYKGKTEHQLEEENRPPPTINLRTLEILENDAIDTLCRMTLALPHLIGNLTSLNLRSTLCLDFRFLHESMIQHLLPQLSGLETLKLSIGEVFTDESRLLTLYQWLPPNISTLRFRGPASLAKSPEWDNWVQAFAERDFLPNLERLSFVLDLHYEPSDDSGRSKKLKTIPEHTLHEARAACEPLYEAVRNRGIVIERLYDEWSDECQILRQVDDRWLC
ncbi:hypothetical protein BDV38DRAFT_141314 [Aspergillus pseudotamarii]|uniref:Uncharacterized protein n=1 Tax=Aspergillus pseudotamarii TaxID=132259 RepID=A0A5N6SL33_ASPPS|nr:uncharacterized protein BDV38DRAFT_141314 [Aspergillus pseudotamarii]KAE8135408.1 hypothetical protein BDV38DRAFT_141314 [Aspergillus pseudotamarii]